MTLQEAKDKIAISEGHADWTTLRFRENSTSVELLWEQAAELYAREYAKRCMVEATKTLREADNVQDRETRILDRFLTQSKEARH